MAEQEIEEKQTNKKQGKQYIGCVGNSFSIGYNFFFFPPQKRQLEPSCLSTVLFLYIALKHVTFHLGFVRFRSSICFKFLDLSEWYCRKSILALGGGQPGDTYNPWTKSCEIKFLTFKDDDPGGEKKAHGRRWATMTSRVTQGVQELLAPSALMSFGVRDLTSGCQRKRTYPPSRKMLLL